MGHSRVQTTKSDLLFDIMNNLHQKGFIILNFQFRSSKEAAPDSAMTGAISKHSPMGRWQSTLEMSDFDRGKVDR